MAYAIAKWKCPSIHALGKLRLLPGVNMLDKAQHDELVSHPIMRKHIAAGSLEVDVLPENSHGLAGMHHSQAIKLVGETFDRNLLNAWLGDEQRASVRKAIDAQLAAISISEDEKAASAKAPAKQAEDEEHFS